jgi:DNA-binding NtrC family response regulator
MTNTPSNRPTHQAQTSLVQSAAAARLELTVERESGAPAARKLVLDGDLFRLGSHPSNDLVLNDRSVSRFHCRFGHENGVWKLTDSGSLNGTRLQSVKIFNAELPASECLVELGDTTIRVRELSPSGSIALLDRPSFGDLFGTSVAMRKLFAVLERVASSEANVLIEGESGTGKELVATEIVRRGPRARKPFVIVDCSAISPNLIESELFGHVRGAFTNADRDRIGAFEAAHGGTMFLDEIGEMPLDMQPKLLRALESREIRRIGETQTRRVDVRVVAATNRKLEREVNHGRFREDLYFRLSVVTLRVPSLRERAEDIPLLLNVFLEALNAQSSSHLFTTAVLNDLTAQDWPGNVRELRNYVERAVVLQATTPGGYLDNAERKTIPAGAEIDLNLHFRIAKEKVVAEFERRYVSALLEWADGNVSKAARKGAMDRMNLYRLMQRYGLRQTGKDE